MKRIWALTYIVLLGASPQQAANAEIWGFEGERNRFTDFVWQYNLKGFEEAEYHLAVERLFWDFENVSGKRLSPGPKRMAGIKVYSNSGRGISTPRPLVRAVVAALKARGWQNHELFVMDAMEFWLRDSGFLPPLSLRKQGDNFFGVPVWPLDRGSFFDPLWFYENPLPSKSARALSAQLLGEIEVEALPEERKSFLARPLLTEVDFWINLPMVMDHPAVGVNGALINATLWNASNRDRFFVSPANAPIAVAEIAATPELLAGWVVTLMTLERFQFIGGPVFNSLYTRSEPILWMSVDPVRLDTLILQRMNRHRANNGFDILGDELPMLHFSEQLGVGSQVLEDIKWIVLP